MNGQFDSASWLSTALMFALVGAGVMQTSPRNAGRPPAVEQIPNIPLYTQRISARLWEDPLEVARRVEKNRDGDVEQENNQKWTTAPAAFLEQTQLDYRTGKLTALALRDALRARSNERERDDEFTGGSPDHGEGSLAAEWPEVEALERALSWRALFELKKRELGPNAYQMAKFEKLFAQALAMQQDPPSEFRPPPAEGAREELNARLIESLTQRIEERLLKKAQIVANPQEQGPLSSGLRRQIAAPLAYADSKRSQSPEEQQAGVQHQNAPFDQRLHSALIEAMLSKRASQHPRSSNSIPQSDWTLTKILEIPEKKTLLLPIIVPEQMYPEVREQRLRMRYAVVSALAAANFNPESADELNVVPVPICTKLGQPGSGQVVTAQAQTDHSWIPVLYEIFRKSSQAQNPQSESRGAAKSEYWQVVVFWVDSRIAKEPWLLRKNIKTILDTLCPPLLRDVHFVSTQGSETLTEMLASDEGLAEGTKGTFYFPFATVPKDWLRVRVLERITNASPPANQEPLVRMRPVKRVQASDDYVIEMLLNELSLRLPSFGKRDGEVCLFYETDSFYGRSMVDVFNSRYREFTNRKDAKIESIPYLKGVDGRLPFAQEPSSPTELNLQDTTALLKAFNKRFMEGKSGQWVLDQRQTDYVERWASHLKSSQSKQRIKAIGVFGTNVFDKIKVIEILRQEFRDVWFFTVDLDASLINNDNPLATRNVLVGSAMDLSVDTGVFKSPEFRDSYQSAAFLSTLDALGLLGNDYEGKPGVWETSRIGFEPLKFSGEPRWRLDSMDEERACISGPVKGVAWSWNTFLESHFQAADRQTLARILRPLLLIFTTILLVAVAKVVVEAWKADTKPRWHREMASRFQRALPAGSYKRVVAGMFAAIAAICLFGLLAQKVLGGFSEPFHWFNGVSVWPSLLIRAFASVLGFYFFMRSFVDIDGAIRKMWTQTENGFLLEGLRRAGFSESNIESRYCLRLLTLVVAFVILQWTLIHLLGLAGGYFTPARGIAAFLAHELTFLFSMAAFYLLVWSAVLRHLRCRELLNALDELTGSEAPSGKKEKTASQMSALSKPEFDALIAYNQAVVQSILYPFAMLVVLLASRHPVFDAWNFPPSLLISNALILGILVFSAYLLNQSADQFASHQQRFAKTAGDPSNVSRASATWEKDELKGSFVPFWKQPVIQALSLAVAGVGLQWIA